MDIDDSMLLQKQESVNTLASLLLERSKRYHRQFESKKSRGAPVIRVNHV